VRERVLNQGKRYINGSKKGLLCEIKGTNIRVRESPTFSLGQRQLAASVVVLDDEVASGNIQSFFGHRSRHQNSHASRVEVIDRLALILRRLTKERARSVRTWNKGKK
jgi:hypothetical protein